MQGPALKYMLYKYLKCLYQQFYKMFYCCHSWCVLSGSIGKQNSIMYDLYMNIS